MKINRWSFAALSLATAVLFGASAHAQDEGFYIAGDLGYHAPSQLSSTVVGSDEKWQWGVRGNAAGFLRLGYNIDSDWRVEIEGGYRPSDLSSVRADVFLPVPVFRAPGIRLGDVGGDVDATTAMANVLYDVPLGLPVRPFIGGGVGLVDTAVKAHGTYPFCDICLKTPICFVCSVPLNVDDSSDRFGFQGIAGISWPFAPQWTLDATYRYVRANDVTWAASGTDVVFGADRFRADYSDNSVTIGVRYDFGGG